METALSSSSVLLLEQRYIKQRNGASIQTMVVRFDIGVRAKVLST